MMAHVKKKVEIIKETNDAEYKIKLSKEYTIYNEKHYCFVDAMLFATFYLKIQLTCQN